jgi:hypothetical protein
MENLLAEKLKERFANDLRGLAEYWSIPFDDDDSIRVMRARLVAILRAALQRLGAAAQ